MQYADYTAIFADRLEGLQALIQVVADISNKYGLKLNRKKTVHSNQYICTANNTITKSLTNYIITRNVT